MVNTLGREGSDDLRLAARLVAVYVTVVLATVVALGILSGVDPDQATESAWTHAAIVGFFAVLLQVRLLAARRGSHRAAIAVGVIATALVLVNVVEALLPGLFPLWMRIEMVAIAILMAALAAQVLRRRR